MLQTRRKDRWTECTLRRKVHIRKFKGTGAFQKEKRILHQKVADVGIKASLQTGMVSINDRNRNQAIAVSITEMVAVLNEALRYGTAGMGKKVRL
nr:MAG: hypothetical protein [Bacteriophage sp.]